MPKLFSALMGGATLLALSGCMSPDLTHNELGVPDYPITNVFVAEAYPVDLRRVVVLPVSLDGGLPEVRQQLDATFRAELGQSRRFEIVQADRAQMQHVFGQEAFVSQESVPFGFYEHWREKYGADAVMFVDVAHYRPYRPITIGVRARLVHTESEETIWAVDEVFDAGNPQVAVSAQRFHRAYNDSPFPADMAGSVLQSPARFSKYVAWQIFQVLPENTDGG